MCVVCVFGSVDLTVTGLLGSVHYVLRLGQVSPHSQDEGIKGERLTPL